MRSATHPSRSPIRFVTITSFLALGLASQSPAPLPVTFEELVTEAADLDRLTRLPSPSYRNIQWSSTDRRSYNGPDSPGWFGNADGFGGEPIPGFAATLREPGADGVGLWLLGEHRGPGALVRTWTAGMGGVLRVYLDGAEAPFWEGPAALFLARRSLVLGGERPPGSAPGALQMEDADHLPIPFAKGLRITWEGTLRELHFYQVQIRAYPAGTAVRTFEIGDLMSNEEDVAMAARRLRAPQAALAGAKFEAHALDVPARGRTSYAVDAPDAVGGQFRALRIRVDDAPDLAAALRGIVLRVAFDDSRRPQVEAPLGDLFGSGPGVNPYESLPISVASDGTMTCRFPMPFARRAEVELEDFTGAGARVTVAHALAPYAWDDRSLHFRARWRNSVGLDAGGGARPIDLPYVMLRGQGRLVGVACMVVNPSGIPTPGGNWWGEGDEKVFVDDERQPSILGTGSEDYFDYSWSRPRLFMHPYCGQPLDSGPGTAGFVSNHRFQILDDIPFDRSLWFAMELYTHRALQDVDYARIAYCYARPGAVDDHVPPTAPELALPDIPIHEPVADGGARGAVLLNAWDLSPRIGAHAAPRIAEPLATRHEVVGGKLEAGDVLALTIRFESPGAWDLNVVGTHRPDGAVVEFWMDGQRLAVEDQEGPLALRTDHVTRVLSRKVSGPLREAGEATLELRCVEPGFVGLDYLWLKRGLVVVPGMVEAESMQVTAHSDGLEWQRQGLRGDDWSRAEHLWIRGKAVGDFVELVGTAPAAGRYRAKLVLTRSHDYAILKASVHGRVVGDSIDTYGRLSVMEPIDCGEIEVGNDRQIRVRLEIVGRNPESGDPGTYFGIDGVVLEKI